MEVGKKGMDGQSVSSVNWLWTSDPYGFHCVNSVNLYAFALLYVGYLEIHVPIQAQTEQ